MSSSSSLLPIFLNPPVHHKRRTSLFAFPLSSSSNPLRFKTLVCFASQFDRDESLWLREEQRWLREEQRWLREEKRWLRDREALLRRVSELELRIQAMDRRSSVQTDGVAAEIPETIAGLVEVLNEKSMISETSSSASPMVLDEKTKTNGREEEDVVVERIVRVVSEEPKKKKKKKRSSLRIGSEGEDVRALQEALEKLGFYSGEEDIEFSMFSSGTERAVKTWQASIGAREDGIVTEDLLAILFLEKIADVEEKEVSNGAAVSSVTEISNVMPKAVKEEAVTGVEVYKHRVFLLGENRWEEPSRLVNKTANQSQTNSKQTTSKCIACRGEGRLLCTECDGTGEPNVEPQFVEWVDEGANCPYCEGLGYTICDVCDGKLAP